MDPISHGLLGAAIGYAAFGPKLGRNAATAGALSALVPDADVFIRSATDPLMAIEFHRHFTHSLIFAPIGAAFMAMLWWWRAKWHDHRLTLWLCCLAGYVSHCLLDASTSFGTQLLWPFSRYRSGWDLISIVDPAFTLALLIGLIWAIQRKNLRPAWVALAFCSLYLALGGLQAARATAAQTHLARSRGHTIERREVMPTLANNVVWRTLYVHDGQIHADRIRVGWFSRGTVVEGWSLPVVTEAELTPEEKERDAGKFFERFDWFADGWIARKPSDESILGDMRYSLSTAAFDPIWGIRFTPKDALIGVEWVNRSRNRRISLRELWDEIVGRDARYRSLTEAGLSRSAASNVSPEMIR